MTPPPRRAIVATWYGAFLVEGREVRRSELSPTEPAELIARAKTRLGGGLTEEEHRLLEGVPREGLVSRDRRFESEGVRWAPVAADAPAAEGLGFAAALHREVLLASAAEALRSAWDPSIHVEEAVRASADLDRVLNLVAERLTGWAGRDAIVTDLALSDDPRRVAREIVDGSWGSASELPRLDAALTEGRRALARLYLEALSARDALDAAVVATLPRRAPNLSALLGPDLAARLISHAGGLERLARLPASTVQVLGAERAFFEHLRGRGSSPRHGLLFLHPKVQSARRPERGKLARALAGKTSIAARLDFAGAALRPELAASFEARAKAIRASPRSRERGRKAL